MKNELAFKVGDVIKTSWPLCWIIDDVPYPDDAIDIDDDQLFIVADVHIDKMENVHILLASTVHGITLSHAAPYIWREKWKIVYSADGEQ